MFDTRRMAMTVVALMTAARAAGADEPAAPAGPEPAARSIAEIHAMPTERLVAGVEARFRGVVTTVQSAGRLLTIQEDGVATWVAVPPDLAQPGLVPGAEIEVEGTAQRSMFVPIVRPHRIVVVGHGPLPEPTPADFARLSRGLDDARPLDVAKRMVKHAATDLRSSVWALRTAPAAGRSFTQSLRELVDHLNVERGSQESPPGR